MRLLGKTCTLGVAGVLAFAMFPAAPMTATTTRPQEAYALEESADSGTTYDIGQLNMTSQSLYTYTGKAVVFEISFERDGVKLKEGTDYTLSYWTARTKNGKTTPVKKLRSAPKAIGRYRVMAKGKGSYTGTYSYYFDIAPKPTSLKKLAFKKKQLTVTWKKQSAHTDGYVILVDCLTTANKWGDRRYVTVKGKNKTSLTLKKLKDKGTYYVMIATYKKVGGAPVESYWSKQKKMKVG